MHTEKPLQRHSIQTAFENRLLFIKRELTVFNIIGFQQSLISQLLQKSLLSIKHLMPAATLTTDKETALKYAQYDTHLFLSEALSAISLQRNILKTPSLQSSILFIENLNSYDKLRLIDFGEVARILVISSKEIESLCHHQPQLLRIASLVLIMTTESDRIQNYSEIMTNRIRSENPDISVFICSLKHNEGIDQWCQWLCIQQKRLRMDQHYLNSCTNKI